MSGIVKENSGSLGIRLKKRCLNSFWFLFAAYMLYWEPAWIKTQIFWADKLFDAGNLLVLLVILYFFFSDREISGFDIALLSMGIVLLGSTAFHQRELANIWKCLKYLWPVGAVCMLTETGMRENPWLVIRAQYAMCWFQIAVNTVTVVLFPGGLYKGGDGERQFWLGNENVFIMTILAGLCVGALDVLRRGRRFAADYLLFCMFSVVSVVLVWSATAIIGLMVFFGALLCTGIIRWDPLYRMRNGIAIWLAGFCGITIFRLQFLFEPLIVGVLHKKLTLTSRTRVWDYVMERVKLSPVWGYGVESAEQFSGYMGGNPHWVHAHNYILELAVKGGGVLLALFAVLLCLTAAKLDRHIARQGAKVFSIGLLAFFVVFIGDCFEMRTLFYMILASAYSCDALFEGAPGALRKMEGKEWES